MKITLALFALLLTAPLAAQANHALVNCGAPGFWDNSLPSGGHETMYYVWLMNDDLVQLQLPDQDWTQLGEVKGPKGVSIADIEPADLAEGDEFKGPQFSMELTEEFKRPRQPKNRRFFRAKFSVKSVKQ